MGRVRSRNTPGAFRCMQKKDLKVNSKIELAAAIVKDKDGSCGRDKGSVLKKEGRSGGCFLIEKGLSRVFQGMVVPHIVGIASIAPDGIKPLRIVGLQCIVRCLIGSGFAT